MFNYEISNIFVEEFPAQARIEAWRRRLKALYGITIKQYNELLKKQDYRCALCGRHRLEFKTRFAIDHDHHTQEIRSLLCSYCNLRVIGRLRRDNIQRVYDYLNKEYTGWFVPKKKRKKKRKSWSRKTKTK